MFGIGAHLITTPETPIGVSYIEDGNNASLLTINNTISPREFEAIYAGDLNFIINDRWFVRFSGARDFGRTIFRESASGLGAQFNLSGQRPVFLKLSAQHSTNRYARIVGNAINNNDQISLSGKNFNSDKIRVFYGSRTRHLKLSGELTVEMNKDREIYFRGSY